MGEREGRTDYGRNIVSQIAVRTHVQPIPDAIIQLVKAMARRQARMDVRSLEAANDNKRPQ
jgi:hypothetical protein